MCSDVLRVPSGKFLCSNSTLRIMKRKSGFFFSFFIYFFNQIELLDMSNKHQ